MIEQIKGIVVEKAEKSLTILLGGIGLKIWTTNQVLSHAQIGENIQLVTELVLRETEINLYGFENEHGRNMFRVLLKISGIGPKAAMAIISTLAVQEIYRAIQTKDFNQFTQVPGIGKKTAQKIILFLQDSPEIDRDFQIDPTVMSINADLLEALVGLGYSVVEAQSCIQSLPEDTPIDLETRLRIALQYFSG